MLSLIKVSKVLTSPKDGCIPIEQLASPGCDFPLIGPAADKSIDTLFKSEVILCMTEMGAIRNATGYVSTRISCAWWSLSKMLFDEEPFAGRPTLVA